MKGEPGKPITHIQTAGQVGRGTENAERGFLQWRAGDHRCARLGLCSCLKVRDYGLTDIICGTFMKDLHRGRGFL